MRKVVKIDIETKICMERFTCIVFDLNIISEFVPDNFTEVY